MNPLIISNRYLLREIIGVGGTGTVYRATDRITRRDVALKRVQNPTGVLQPIGDHDLGDGLAAEFRLLATLRHPNIINVMDYGIDEDDLPYYTMQLLESPRTILEAGISLSINERLQLLCQALRALDYLHRRGVMHRDIKPSNLLVEGRRVYLVDFGLAIHALRGAGDAGTLLYVSPESLADNRSTAASDIYSLGVLAYQLFGGGHPYSLVEDTPYHLLLDAVKHTPIPVETLFRDDDVSNTMAESIRLLLNSMVQKQPTQRATDASALLRRFSALIAEPVNEDTALLLEMPHLVGRRKELRALNHALDRVQDATRDVWAFVKRQPSVAVGSAWLIGGESGVGKSRLLQELNLEALTRGFLVLRGQHSPNASIPLAAWQAPVQHLLLHSNTTELQIGVLQRLIPSLGRLLNLKPLPTAPDTYSIEQLRRTIVALFQELSQPTLLLLEDLHHADDSLQLLAELAEHVVEMPLVIVATYRSDEQPALHENVHHLRHLLLERLRPAEVAELSRQLIGGRSVDASLADWLTTQTEGNPFFLIETLRTLADRAGGLHHVTEVPHTDTLLPPGLLPLIDDRLSRISDLDRDLLAIAAVIGRDLDLTLLSMYSEQLDGWLLRCANAHVLEYADGVWRFSHEKLREGVLVQLGPNNVAPHWCALVAYDTFYADDPRFAPRVFDLALHVGDTERSYLAALLAADHAASNQDFLAAMGWYEAVLALGYAEPTPDVLIRYARMLLHANHVKAALPLVRRVQAESAGDMAIMAETEALLAVAMYNTQHYLHALQHGQSALNYYERLGHIDASCLATVGRTYRALGNYAAAEAIHRRVFTTSQQQNNVIGVARAYVLLLTDAYMQGDSQRANDLFDEALPTVENCGDKAVLAALYSHSSVVAHRERRYFNAISRLQHSQQLLAHHPDAELSAFNHLYIGEAHFALRDYDTAMVQYRQAIELAVGLSTTHPVLLQALAGIAHIAIHTRSDMQRATQWLMVLRNAPLAAATTQANISAVWLHHQHELPIIGQPLPTLDEVIAAAIAE